MLKTILHFHTQSLDAIEAGTETSDIFKLAVREEIARAKYIPKEQIDKIPQIRKTIENQIKELQPVKA